MYNSGCCGETFLPERVQWCHLRRNRHSHIGTNLCTRMSFALIRQSVLPEVSFSEVVRFAEDEARFRLF
jgi:hypothetical protein